MQLHITILENEEAFDQAATDRIIAQILSKRDAVIGLSTGQTTKNMHRLVCELHRSFPFDVSAITVFGQDEIMNVPREYKGSCYAMIKDQLVDPLGIPAENFIMPPTMSADMEKECKLFEQAIENRGRVDLQVLGLGTNGHIGFNQPGTPFGKTTWLSEMDEVLEIRIRKETNTPPGKKLGGLTLGPKNIMHSRKILLVAKGESKAEIVQQMLEGPVTEQVPASILQLHPNCEFLLDTASARLLKRK